MEILLILLVLIVLFFIFKYNNIIALRNRINQSSADINVQLKNRFDLVGNLVNTVKGYAKHEKSTFEEITKARTIWQNADNVEGMIKADNKLTGALKTLFAVSENYPDLKANENFLQLQNELSDLENKIASSRRFFNSTVMEYNTAIQVFPMNLFVGMFNFKPYSSFELENEEEKKVPKVEF